MSERNSKLLPEEEIVLWRKSTNNFRIPVVQNTGDLPTQSEWVQFSHNIRSIAPNTDIVFVSVPKNSRDMTKALQNTCHVLKKYPDFFNLSISQTYRCHAEALDTNGLYSISLGLDVEALKCPHTIEEKSKNQSKKMRVLKFLYQIKCCEETDELKILLQHNQSTLEASEFVAIVFIFTLATEQIAAPKNAESKIRRKSNVLMEM